MAELFRFRCSECQKLLGVAPRKVGKAVDCPRCGAELIVPSPDDDDSDASASLGDDASDEAPFGGLGIDLGFSSPLNIRPAAERPDDRPPDEAEALAFLARVAESAPIEPTSSPPGPDFAALAAAVDDSETDAEPETDPEPEPLVATPAEPLVARGRRGRRLEPTVDRRRDVVLPRTAVVAWAMFAILALGFSFVAGLMIGHYRWR